MIRSLPSIPMRKNLKPETGLKISKQQRQTSLYTIDDADLDAMVKASGQTPSYVIRELVHEMLQQLRAGDGTDVKLNRSVLLAQERVTRNGVQPLVAKIDDIKRDVSTSLASFRETANRIDGSIETLDSRLARLEEQAAAQTRGLRRITEACAVTLGVLRHYVLFHFARLITAQERAEGRVAPSFTKIENGYLRWTEALRKRAAEGDIFGEIRFKETVAQTAEVLQGLTAMTPPQAAPTTPPAAPPTKPAA